LAIGGACQLDLVGVEIDPGDVRDAFAQLPCEDAFAAADVERALRAVGNRVEHTRLIVDVVVPSGPAGHRTAVSHDRIVTWLQCWPTCLRHLVSSNAASCARAPASL